MATPELDNMTEEEIEQAMQAFGERLAHMLNVAKLPDDQKQAWAAVIPQMSFDQLDRFTETLGRFVDAAAAEELGELKSEIEKIQTEYESEEQTCVEDTKGKLDVIMAKVKAAEEQGKQN